MGQDRTNFLVNEGMNARVLKLYAEPEGNSEDEKITENGEAHYYIVPKEARSASATLLARKIDETRKKTAKLLGRGRYLVDRDRDRVDAPAGHTSTSLSHALPEDVPLDWFSPDYFNDLPASMRARYHDSPIALPLPRRLWEDPKRDWKTMQYKLFMTKYGDEVKAQYLLPTDEELAAIEENAKAYYGDENDGDDEQDDDEDMGDDINP